MKKLGRILLIIGIILIVLVSGAGIYLYNFHVFETVRLCAGEARDLGTPCEVTTDCTDLIKKEIESNIGDAPDFIQGNFQKIVDETFY